jgi:hypothetical protein
MAKSKKKKTQQIFNIEGKVENIKTLNQTNRMKESIAYIYLIYAELMQQKFGQPRKFFETIRDYAITCVTKLGQNPESVYPFIQKIEETIYGGIEPAEIDFKNIINLFSKLYTEITGKQFRY